MAEDLPISIITHCAGELTPGHHLSAILDRWEVEHRVVSLPMHFCKVETVLVEEHRNGKTALVRRGPRRPGSIWAQLLRDLAFNLRLFLPGRRTGVLVCLDNLNAFCGILLRRLGRADQVVYYVIDHTPRRFGNRLLNWLYARFDVFCCRHADWLWVLNERMGQAKAERGASDSRRILTPIGVELKQIAAPSQPGRPGSLVVVSHLDRSKGIQLILESLPEILARVPEATLTVFGGGPYEAELHALADRLHLGDKVVFKGFVPSHAEVLGQLPGFRVGLAPYLMDEANYTWWADPAKPKEYLAAGLPVVITKVPPIAEDIAARPMGLAIAYEKGALVEACVRLLTDEAFYARCRSNALAASRDWDWEGIFARSLKRVDAHFPVGG